MPAHHLQTQAKLHILISYTLILLFHCYQQSAKFTPPCPPPEPLLSPFPQTGVPSLSLHPPSTASHPYLVQKAIPNSLSSWFCLSHPGWDTDNYNFLRSRNKSLINLMGGSINSCQTFKVCVGIFSLHLNHEAYVKGIMGLVSFSRWPAASQVCLS